MTSAWSQEPILLVSNLAQTSDAPQFAGDILEAWDNRIVGNVFRTGPSQSGWLLSAVTLDINRWPRGTTPIVSIYRAELHGEPGLPVPTTRIATLENPWAGMGWRTFTVSSRVQLKANRFYAIVVDSTATTAEGAIELRSTRSFDEDAGSQTGWDIDRISHSAADDTEWSGTSASASSHKVRFAVHGYDAGEAWRERAKLESLTVTPVTGSLVRFGPSFRPRERGPYTAWVTNDTRQLTLEAVAESPSARVDMPADVDPNADGTQIDIPAGAVTRHQIRVFDGPSGIFRTYYQLVVRHPGSTLTGNLRKLEPQSSGGSLRYRFAFELSAPVELSLADLRSDVFTVTNGAIVEARRPVGRAVGPGGDPLSRTWHLTVAPVDAAVDTVIGFRIKASCTATGAVCTVGGLKLDSLESLTFGSSDLPTVSVEDTSANEGDGWMLFPVKLSRALRNFHVTYDFETIDSGADKGTATPGEDYLIRPKYSMYIQTGQKKTKQTVRIVDDSIDDDGETVKVRIGSARLVDSDGNAVAALAIAKAVATGTIRNADAIPKAWIARFGRTVAAQAVDAIGARVGGAQGTRIVIAGTTTAEDAGSVVVDPGVRGRPRHSPGFRNDSSDFENWNESRASGGGPGMTLRQLALTSEFRIDSGTAEDGPVWTTWGQFAATHFEASPDGLALDGDVTTGFLGFDVARERWLAGAAVSLSRGDGSFELQETHGDGGIDGGTVESRLTSLYPYARYRLGEGTDIWAMAGHGTGQLTLTKPADGNSARDVVTTTGMSMRMGALGARGRVVSPEDPGDLEVAVRTDAFWVRTQSDAVASANSGRLEASTGDASRVRLLLEGSRTIELGDSGTTFTPSAEVGIRHDGGDAETGTGVVAGIGARLAAQGVAVDVAVRSLVAHDERDYEGWGVSGSIRIDPGPSGRGLSLGVAPQWGTTGYGAERLWSLHHPARNRSRRGAGSERRLTAELGYGLQAPAGCGVVTPYMGAAWTDDGAQSYRLGARWNVTPRATLEIEGTHRDAGGEGGPVDAIALRTRWRW